MEKVKFKTRKLDSLIPYARNARTHTPEQVAKIAASIREFGFLNPVIVSNEGDIIAGHGRVLAARQLGLDEVPCIEESHLSESQRRAYILADNRLALDAGWDEEMLANEIKSIMDDGFNVELTGFSDDEIKQYAQDVMEQAIDDPTDDDEVAIDDSATVTELGDLWILGVHRLICGDSTQDSVVRTLFGNDSPNIMVTDPPYGVNYDAFHHGDRRKGKVLNDDKKEWIGAYRLFHGNVAYVWFPDLYSDSFISDIRQAGFTINAHIVWVKNNLAAGFSDYRWQHENCIYATRGPHNWQGGRDKSTVWEIPSIHSLEKNEGAWGHSTQKPIECMKRPIENNTYEGEWVYDPFCGTGTTIIACERTRRKCLAVELSPQYCDAIIRRWQKETGRQARKSSGELFDELNAI